MFENKKEKTDLESLCGYNSKIAVEIANDIHMLLNDLRQIDFVVNQLKRYEYKQRSFHQQMLHMYNEHLEIFDYTKRMEKTIQNPRGKELLHEFNLYMEDIISIYSKIFNDNRT